MDMIKKTIITDQDWKEISEAFKDSPHLVLHVDNVPDQLCGTLEAKSNQDVTKMINDITEDNGTN